jgi:hypothetical protein
MMADIKEPELIARTQSDVDAENGTGTVEDLKMRDIAASLFVEGNQISPEELEEESVRVRKILDWRIMLIVCADISPFDIVTNPVPNCRTDLSHLFHSILGCVGASLISQVCSVADEALFLRCRQTLAQLCIRIHLEVQLGSRGPAVLLGRGNLQLWISVLGSSSKRPDPTAASRKVSRGYDPSLERAPHRPHTLYAGGDVAGSNIFFAREARRYFSALTGLLICYGGMIVLVIFSYFAMKFENMRRDKAMDIIRDSSNEGPDADAVLDRFKDMIDRESNYFRY